MAKNFKTLRDKMPAERIERNENAAKAKLFDLPDVLCINNIYGPRPHRMWCGKKDYELVVFFVSIEHAISCMKNDCESSICPDCAKTISAILYNEADDG